MKIILHEASNMTPAEKMRAWAQGYRKENIGACGLSKLEAYGDLCVGLALQEPNLAQSYLKNATSIVYELDGRGEATYANALRTRIQSANLKLKGQEGAEKFLTAAFDLGWAVIVKDYGADLEDLRARAEALDISAVAKEINDFIIDRSRDSWVASHKTMLDSNKIIATSTGDAATIDNLNKMTPEDYGKHFFYYKYYDAFLRIFSKMTVSGIEKKGAYKYNGMGYDRVSGSFLNHTVTTYYKSLSTGTVKWFRMHVPTWEAVMNTDLESLQMQRIFIQMSHSEGGSPENVDFVDIAKWVKNFRDTYLQ